jgi:hypothetical protein
MFIKQFFDHKYIKRNMYRNELMIAYYYIHVLNKIPHKRKWPNWCHSSMINDCRFLNSCSLFVPCFNKWFCFCWDPFMILFFLFCFNKSMFLSCFALHTPLMTSSWTRRYFQVKSRGIWNTKIVSDYSHFKWLPFISRWQFEIGKSHLVNNIVSLWDVVDIFGWNCFWFDLEWKNKKINYYKSIFFFRVWHVLKATALLIKVTIINELL